MSKIYPTNFQLINKIMENDEKTTRRNKFQFFVETSGNKLKISFVRNNKINGFVFKELKESISDKVMFLNGEKEWCKNIISFKEGNKTYLQVNAEKRCEGCCFLNQKENDIDCLHPHYTSKGNCIGKIYVCLDDIVKNLSSKYLEYLKESSKEYTKNEGKEYYVEGDIVDAFKDGFDTLLKIINNHSIKGIVNEG